MHQAFYVTPSSHHEPIKNCKKRDFFERSPLTVLISNEARPHLPYWNLEWVLALWLSPGWLCTSRGHLCDSDASPSRSCTGLETMMSFMHSSHVSEPLMVDRGFLNEKYFHLDLSRLSIFVLVRYSEVFLVFMASFVPKQSKNLIICRFILFLWNLNNSLRFDWYQNTLIRIRHLPSRENQFLFCCKAIFFLHETSYWFQGLSHHILLKNFFSQFCLTSLEMISILSNPGKVLMINISFLPW